MKFSSVLTGFAAAAAAWNGVRSGPVPPSHELAPTDPLLMDVRNQPLPPGMAEALAEGYFACQQRVTENRRIFGGHTPEGIEALCLKTAGRAAAFKRALNAPPSELPVILHGLKRIDQSDSPLPLPELNMADYSIDHLFKLVFDDYRQSGSTGYAAIKARQVEVLGRHVPEDQRSSLPSARRAALTPACRADWKDGMQQWARSAVSDMKVIANMRSVGRPQTINVEEEQMYDLVERIEDMEFGASSMKKQMFNDALQALVDAHASVSA